MSFYSCTVSSFEQYTLASFIAQGYFERHVNRMKKYYREQRALILQAIKKSSLGKIAIISERNAGTHFLLTVSTRLTEEEVRKAALEANMSLSFFADYSNQPSRQNGCTLLINYAGIAREKIGVVIDKLAKIFPECK